MLMLGVWYLAMHGVWLFKYLGSMDEIVCAIIYGVYITMYIFIIKNFMGLFVILMVPCLFFYKEENNIEVE